MPDSFLAPKRRRVLVSAETEAARAALTDRLLPAGVEVDAVASLSEAARRIEQAPYLMLLAEVDPGIEASGGFLGRLRASHPDLPIVVTAEAPSVELLVHLIRVGVHDFLRKPIDGKRLSSIVRFLLQRDRSRAVDAPPTRDADGRSSSARNHVSRLTILYQMARDISERENWSDALDRFLMALVSTVGAEGAGLLLFSQEGTRLTPRTMFQLDAGLAEGTCRRLLGGWRDNPRGAEIHCIECYEEQLFNTCLERNRPWRLTVVPLEHRNRPLGFLLLDKAYRSGLAFREDYQFFTSIQTVLAEEVANASYISELRQLGRFNQSVLDNIHSGVITTDVQGAVRFFNQRAASLCKEVVGGEVVHFDELFRSRTVGPRFFDKIMGSSRDTHVFEVMASRSRGEFPARLCTSKMHDDNLNGTVLVAIFEDLTDQKRLEHEVRRNDRLRVLGQLSAGVAHEIRNPLTGIATSAEVLAGKIKADPEKNRYIRAILDEIHRLDDIIRNLLNYARPAKPQMVACRLPDLSGRVLGLLSDQAHQKGVGLEVRDELENAACMADPNQLTQVLLNVVLNSIQACRKGDRVQIVLQNETTPEQRAYARIDVIDNGPGIHPDVRESLFDPFVTTRPSGTGLGLAISQQIIEEHHGKISCQELPVGTQFVIRLPIDIKTNASAAASLDQGS